MKAGMEKQFESWSRGILLVILLLSSITIQAHADDSLSWGIAEGDRYNFVLSYQGESITIYDSIYCELIEIFEIPEAPIEVFDCLLHMGYVDKFFQNGSELPDGVNVNDPHSPFGNRIALIPFVFALGNLSLVSNLFASCRSNRDYQTTYLSSQSYWGYNLTGTFEESGPDFLDIQDLFVDIHLEYERTNGILSHYSVRFSFVTNGSLYYKMSLVRENLTPEILNPVDIDELNSTSYLLDPLNPFTTVMYGLAGVAWTAVIVFIFWDYRNRRST